MAAQSKAAPTDLNYLMADGITKPKDQLQETRSIGGRTVSKPETKKAKTFHPNTENNEDRLNSRWQEHSQRQPLQRQQKLELTGEEHTAQRMGEQLKRGPAPGLMEGLVAGGFGYNLGYTDGVNADLDMIAIERAAKQQEVFEAKSNQQKKQAVRKTLGIGKKCYSYQRGSFKQQFDTFLKSTAK
jgi:hypothetical protein